MSGLTAMKYVLKHRRICSTILTSFSRNWPTKLDWSCMYLHRQLDRRRSAKPSGTPEISFFFGGGGLKCKVFVFYVVFEDFLCFVVFSFFLKAMSVLLSVGILFGIVCRFQVSAYLIVFSQFWIFNLFVEFGYAEIQALWIDWSFSTTTYTWPNFDMFNMRLEILFLCINLLLSRTICRVNER